LTRNITVAISFITIVVVTDKILIVD